MKARARALLLLVLFVLLSCAVNSQQQTPPTLRTPTHDLDSLFFGSFQFSPDGKTFMCLGDGAAHLWDVRTGKKRRDLDQQAFDINGGSIRDDGPHIARFSPDGKTFLTVTNESDRDGSSIVTGTNKVKFWDTAAWKIKRTLNLKAEAAFFSPDSRSLLLNEVQGSGPQTQNTITLWNLTTGKRQIAPIPAQSIALIGLWRQGKTVLITHGDDGRLSEWNPRTGTLHQLPILPANSFGWLPSPTSNYFAVNDWSHGVHVYDAHLHSVRVLTKSETAFCMTFSNDGTRFAWGDKEGVRIYDTATWHMACRVEGVDAVDIALSPDGAWLAVGDTSKEVCLWRLHHP